MKTIQDYFEHTPSEDQIRAMQALDQFINAENQTDVFILDGSAGSGKTSLMKAVVNCVFKSGGKVQLAAPTGRAAKVLRQHTGTGARTIHNLIYIAQDRPDGTVEFIRRDDVNDRPTLFIIDEASMISDEHDRTGDFIAPGALLSDLIRFVKMTNAKSKVLFIGDRCQLPPVMKYSNPFSGALDENYLCKKFDLSVKALSIRQVVRQKESSQILAVASELRERIENNDVSPFSIEPSARWWQLRDYYASNYSSDHLNKTCVIAYTNKDVNFWNEELRNQIFGTPDALLVAGEQVIFQNNWIATGAHIMKGDSAVIESVSDHTEEFAGLHFKDVKLKYEDHTGQLTSFQSKCLMETLSSPNGLLRKEQEKALKAEVMKRNRRYRDSLKRVDDPYLSAFRLRHGYAMTCHKAQGGEWDRVILHPYRPQTDTNRWTYTAVTRARTELLTWAA